MNREEQSRLDSRLAGMSREEVNRLYKHASALRKRMPKREEATRRVSLADLVLRLIDEEGPKSRYVDSARGIVVWVGPQTARVRGSGAEREAQLARHRVSVGDNVTLGLTEDRKTWQVSGIDDRRTKLSRPDVGNANLERVIVANVDVVCIVVSVVAPPLHPRIIDRYLIAIQRGGAQAVLCVNKLDLLGPADSSELEKLAPYAALDVPIFGCSASTGQGITELREELSGQTAAFVGHSGVGKSSLMNAIFPALNLDTGKLMGGYGRGAHTTSTSSLHEFPDGTRLIDTPGVRSFGLGKMTREDLQWHFPEFQPFGCKFRDCSHDHEPGCAVREAADRGAIHPARHDTYLRLLRDG